MKSQLTLFLTLATSLFILFLFTGFSRAPVVAFPEPSRSSISSAAFMREAEITVKNKKIKVEVAETDEQKSKGLMYRAHLDRDRGMLFIFANEQPLSFWMKNTLIELSIGYFNAEQILIDIQDMTPATNDSPKSYPSRGPAKYALEMNKGWFKQHNIRIGDKFKF